MPKQYEDDVQGTLAALPKYLHDLIENIIEEEKFVTLESVHVNAISTDGGNYLGDLFEIDINGKTENKEDKVLNLFLKRAAEDIKTFNIKSLYLTESHAYSETFRIFNEIQEKAGVPENERFKVAKSYTRRNTEAIVLENLSKKGFKTLYRMDVVPLKFAELSIQELAKFHALSFALEKYNPEYFLKCKQMEYPDEVMKDFDEYLDNMSSSITDHLCPKVQKKIKDFLKKIPGIVRRCLMGPATIKTLCHGDYRLNNILVKEEDGEITEVLPVDYQIVHYKCPVNDFLYFIYSGTDKTFRDKFMVHLKNMYYETMEKFLRHFKIDVDSVFPREEFESLIRNRMEYAYALAFMMIPFIFSKEDDTPELSCSSLADVTFKLNDRFKERMDGNLEEIFERGFF